MANDESSLIDEIFELSEPELEFTPIALEIINDRDKLEWILFVAKSQKDLLEDDLYKCLELQKYKQFTYLIDTDVLRNYIEGKSLIESKPSQKLESYSVDSFFSEPSHRFAFPLGAFHEFLEHLARMLSMEKPIPEEYGTLSADEAVREVALFLNIEDIAELNRDETTSEIVEFLNQKSLELSRLYDVLNNPHFMGVISNYELTDQQEIENIISKLRRHGDRDSSPRDIVDKRDAINLAIAFKSIREAQAIRFNDEKEHTHIYILISQTNVILKLMSKITEKGMGESYETLCRLIGKRPPIPDQILPIMSPKQVNNTQQLGLNQNPLKAVKLAQALRDDHRALTDYLEAIILLLEDPNDVDYYKAKIEPFLETKKKAALQNIAKLSIATFSSDTPFFDFEANRALMVSTAYSEYEDAIEELTPDEKLEKSSKSFLKLMSLVRHSLENVPGMEYKAVISDPMNNVPHQDVSIFFGEPGKTERPLISGQFYDVSDGHGKGKSVKKFYSLSWPISCKVMAFLNDIKSLLLIPSSIDDIDEPIHLINDFKSDFWNEGIIIYTTVGNYGIPINCLWKQNFQDLLSPPKLKEKIIKSLDVKSDLRILEYRLNTEFGDFCFEVVPHEGFKRYVTVISHLNIGKIIAGLFNRTGIVWVAPTKFSHTIMSALDKFPAVPHRR